MAAERHRVAADGEAGPRVVGHEAFGLGHRLQRTGRIVFVDGRLARAVARAVARAFDGLCEREIARGIGPLAIVRTKLSRGGLREEFAGGTHRALGLPERRAPVVAEGS